MSRYTVGIDLAVKGEHVAQAADPEGHPGPSVSLSRTLDGYEKLVRFLEKLPPREDRPDVVLTPTGNAWVPLAVYLKRKGYRAFSVNPVQEHGLREYFSRYVKTDKIDGYVLASVPRVDPEGVHEAFLPEAQVEALRRWTRQRHGMVEHASGIWKRLRAILDQTAPTLAQAFGASLRARVGRAFLKRYVDPAKAVALGKERLGRFLDQHAEKPLGEEKKGAIYAACQSAAGIYAQARSAGQLPFSFEEIQEQVRLELKRLAFEEAQVKRVEKRLQDLYHRYDPDEVLCQPAGIGVLSAATIVGAAGSAGRLGRNGAFKSLVGLVSRTKESAGKWIPGQRITQHSDPLLRHAFYLIGENARREDVEAFELYQRLRDRGRPHTKAVVSVGSRWSGKWFNLWQRYERRRAGDPTVDLTWQWRDAQGKGITKAEAQAYIDREAPIRDALRKAREGRKARPSRRVSAAPIPWPAQAASLPRGPEGRGHAPATLERLLLEAPWLQRLLANRPETPGPTAPSAGASPHPSTRAAVENLLKHG
jgi:transposase